jgi:uncharacterized membrane protein YcaP (DUF421 family)
MDVVARIALIYLFLMVALRLMGKREFGQLSPFELITLLLIPEILTEALNLGEASMTRAIIGVTTLLSLVFLTSVLAYRFPAFGRLTEGEPVTVVQHGYLVPTALHRERVSPQEVLSEMHRAGLERIDEVKWGVIEPDGKISFVAWERGAPRKHDKHELHRS